MERIIDVVLNVYFDLTLRRQIKKIVALQAAPLEAWVKINIK